MDGFDQLGKVKIIMATNRYIGGCAFEWLHVLHHMPSSASLSVCSMAFAVNTWT
jgi:hypothetical protein